jgi:hypothetical protein
VPKALPLSITRFHPTELDGTASFACLFLAKILAKRTPRQTHANKKNYKPILLLFEKCHTNA